MVDYGIIGCSGRIVNAEFLPIKIIYPAILPQTPWVTKLIIKLDHEDGHHSTGASHTFVVLSARHWIISARVIIRLVEKDFVVCRRRKAKLAT